MKRSARLLLSMAGRFGGTTKGVTLYPSGNPSWTTVCFCGTVSEGTVCPTCGRCSLPR